MLNNNILLGKGKIGLLCTLEPPVLCKRFMAPLVLVLFIHRAIIQGKWLSRVSCVPPLDLSNQIQTKNAMIKAMKIPLHFLCTSLLTQSFHLNFLFIKYISIHKLFFCHSKWVIWIFIYYWMAPCLSILLRNTIRYTYIPLESTNIFIYYNPAIILTQGKRGNLCQNHPSNIT